MFNFFSNTQQTPKGYIGYFGLKDWWLDSFTDIERKHIVEVFQPLGAPPDVLVNGDFQAIGDKADTPLSFLTSLAGWFDNPRDRDLAFKIILKAEEYATANAPIFALHFFYPAKMRLFYKKRKDSAALQEAITACEKQISLAEKAAIAFRKEYDGEPLPVHEGYNQLCIIYEKQGKFEDAIKLAGQAKQQGWNGDWNGRITRCHKKLEKLQMR